MLSDCDIIFEWGKDWDRDMDIMQTIKHETIRKESCHILSNQSLVPGHSLGPLPKEVTSNLHFTDRLLYIYTSGTTGLPKAAVIKNSRSE